MGDLSTLKQNFEFNTQLIIICITFCASLYNSNALKITTEIIHSGFFVSRLLAFRFDIGYLFVESVVCSKNQPGVTS